MYIYLYMITINYVDGGSILGGGKKEQRGWQRDNCGVGARGRLQVQLLGKVPPGEIRSHKVQRPEK